jgi:hypothetical protein
MDDDDKKLEEQLGDHDWALIIGRDGNLKGIFIPTGADEDEVPYSIITIMEKYFGVGFDDELDDDDWPIDFSETIH